MGDFRDDDKVCTNYYVCSKCNNPCDVKINNMKEQETIKKIQELYYYTINSFDNTKKIM